jgi:hypothetical protein
MADWTSTSNTRGLAAPRAPRLSAHAADAASAAKAAAFDSIHEARLPRLVVFDLDGTVWSPEMYQTTGGQGRGQSLVLRQLLVVFRYTRAHLLACVLLPVAWSCRLNSADQRVLFPPWLDALWNIPYRQKLSTPNSLDASSSLVLGQPRYRRISVRAPFLTDASVLGITPRWWVSVSRPSGLTPKRVAAKISVVPTAVRAPNDGR